MYIKSNQYYRKGDVAMSDNKTPVDFSDVEQQAYDKTLDASGVDIHWLLHDSGVSRYRISKDTAISESTLSRLASGHILVQNMNFGYAHILTQYARMIQMSGTESGKRGDE